MFGVAAVVGLTIQGHGAAPPAGRGRRRHGRLRGAAGRGFRCSRHAVRASGVAEYRGPARAADGTPLERQPATLDGLAWLARFNPSEYEAITWLRDRRCDQRPRPGGAGGGRRAAAAATVACRRIQHRLPTILAGLATNGSGAAATTLNPAAASRWSNKSIPRDLGVVGFCARPVRCGLHHVGDLGAGSNGEAGLRKFADALEVVFANDRVTIYRWQTSRPSISNDGR